MVLISNRRYSHTYTCKVGVWDLPQSREKVYYLEVTYYTIGGTMNGESQIRNGIVTYQ